MQIRKPNRRASTRPIKSRDYWITNPHEFVRVSPETRATKIRRERIQEIAFTEVMKEIA